MKYSINSSLTVCTDVGRMIFLLLLLRHYTVQKLSVDIYFDVFGLTEVQPANIFVDGLITRVLN